MPLLFFTEKRIRKCHCEFFFTESVRFLLGVILRESSPVWNLGPNHLLLSLTCVLCNRQPFSNNGIFPKFIEQKTKMMRFWSNIKIWIFFFFFGDRGPLYLDSKVGKIQKCTTLISVIFGLNIVNMVFFPNNSSF